MKVIVNEDRRVEALYCAGTQNENDVTELELIVPDIYKDYDKK